MNPGEIKLENVSRRFRVYPQRNMTLKEAVVRWRHVKPEEIWALR
ncbi:MAG: ABC transporter ATP-binding protein, partial [Actinobacteria bacterium]